MLPFNRSALTVTYHKLTRVTTALGGSITLQDPEDPKGKGTRIQIPFAVARRFIKLTKFTQYPKAVEVAILRYGDEVINLERDIATNLLDAVEYPGGRWISNLEKCVNDTLPAELGDKLWFFDGRYIYHFPNNELHRMRHGGEGTVYLSRDQMFRAGVVETIDCYSLDDLYRSKNLMIENRGVIGIVTPNDGFAVTPPIWKNVDAIGSSALTETQSTTDHEDYVDNSSGVTVSDDRRAELIDRLDDNYAVNLNFTLNTAKSIANEFGFDAIEPLQLPEIMISLQTVNIPNLPKEIKSTFSIGLSPSHALAWLMGLLNKAETMEGYLAVRAAIKYLTTKGLFHKHTTRLDTLFVNPDMPVPTQVRFNLDK